MAFVVTHQDIADLTGDAKEFEYKDTGLKVWFKSLADASFQKAYAMLQRREDAEEQELLNKPLDDSFFDDIKPEEKTVHELSMRAFGRFLIADWNAEDTNGEKLKVNADNFIQLTLATKEPDEFYAWCINCASEVTREKAASTSETKKKPSRATNGKKTTEG